VLAWTIYQEFFAWSHIATGFENQRIEIDGIDVWSHEWVETNKTVKVRDPEYGEVHEMNVYEIRDSNRRLVMAAGEFSNGVYGFYTKRRGLPRQASPERH
jgi:hypothetical protein